MLNWETEFKRFCPAFKLLTYFGTAKERKAKRQGWSKANAFHVCITTYRLVTQDARVFRRKKWKYLILDEAHMIKNWRSQRWQTLLAFQTKRRLLLTGTPLQNDLMELWSLMHFLMPHVFASHADFRAWFSQPLQGSVEQGSAVSRQLVQRLHGVLRPFLLRRLKADVEKGLPPKTEHIVPCPLSKRQRRLYEEYIRCSSTQGTLASGNLMGLMNVLMQLRKVCNHPDLFEGRPIVSPLDWLPYERGLRLPALLLQPMQAAACSSSDAGDPLAPKRELLDRLGLLLSPPNAPPPSAGGQPRLPPPLVQEVGEQACRAAAGFGQRIYRQRGCAAAEQQVSLHTAARAAVAVAWRRERLSALAELSAQRSARAADGAACAFRTMASATAGAPLRALLSCPLPTAAALALSGAPGRAGRRFAVKSGCGTLRSLLLSNAERCASLDELLQALVFAIPRVRAYTRQPWASAPLPALRAREEGTAAALQCQLLPQLGPLHTSAVRRRVFFPDRRLVQFDSGKLQELAELLRRLKAGGHKCLIFTQMTKMLDILATFLNLYGYTYCRLDGSTKPEQRQVLMQRFNTDPRLFCFILSTRSGGFGINLVGADSVIFFDSDWNPAMDAQAQDRAHRIGQTRPVHIYRLVCSATIEENILKKATQKRQLDWMAIQTGGFSTDFFTAAGGAAAGGTGTALGGGGAFINPRDFFEGMPGYARPPPAPPRGATAAELAAAMHGAEDEADAQAAQAAQREAEAEQAEFAEEVRPLDDAQLDEEEEEAAAGAVAQAGAADEARAAQARADQEAAARAEAAAAAAAAAAAEAAAEEDEVQASVAAIAAKAAALGAGGSILDALSPVERYALRWVETLAPPSLAGAQLAAVQLQEAAWDAEALERRKAEAEAAAEEAEDPLAVEAWDSAAATQAYQSKVERAQADAVARAARVAAQQAQQAAREARRAAQQAQAAAQQALAEEEAAHEAETAAAPLRPPLRLKVLLAPSAHTPVPAAAAAAAAAAEEAPLPGSGDLGMSRAGRKRKATVLPGFELLGN
jgi:E1A-binding protein p400